MFTDPVADIQSSLDRRNIPVNRVGIKHLKHPIIFEDILPTGESYTQHTIASFDMLVDLPKNVKGTHMSRFVEILNEHETHLSVAKIPAWLHEMVARLHAKEGYFSAQFPYFRKKLAPVSKAKSFLDYQVNLSGVLEKGFCHTYITVIIPVTSLCPCSKEISNYGAHNQRSHVTVTLHVDAPFSLIEIIQLVESKASCDLYSLLKRQDEKVVTEKAYDNPKFVEDLVRDIASALEKQVSVKGYKISSENFESIHNHSAFAEIDKLVVIEAL